MRAYERNEDLSNLLLDHAFRDDIAKTQESWRRCTAFAQTSGIPVPAFSASLAYFDSYRTASLPQNLTQAQRDFFGAHTYERVDQPRGKFFHTNWTGHGGTTTSGSYKA
jgi:6-phosphogluconate dehydrogenase